MVRACKCGSIPLFHQPFPLPRRGGSTKNLIWDLRGRASRADIGLCETRRQCCPSGGGVVRVRVRELESERCRAPCEGHPSLGARPARSMAGICNPVAVLHTRVKKSQDLEQDRAPTGARARHKPATDLRLAIASRIGGISRHVTRPMGCLLGKTSCGTDLSGKLGLVPSSFPACVVHVSVFAIGCVSQQ